MKYIILILGIAFILIALTGCGTEARSPVESESVGVTATLNDIGSTLAWAGGITAAAGVAFSIISLFYPPIAPFAFIFRFAAVGGAGVTGTGVATIWLSDNLWTLGLSIAACVGGVVWWYWPVLVKLWRRRLDGKV